MGGSPRVHAEASRGFRAANEGLLALSRPKGTALQSPRVHAEAGRGFRAANEGLLALSRP